MKESVLSFSCQGEPLVGIMAEPEGVAADVGVVIIVGGPQYRAGSHRQFTLLARHLAGNGFVTLRFDYRGMGDSPGEARDFLGVDADIAAAIDALLASRPKLKRVVLWGLCDAASAALLYLHSTPDPRVAGLALANPWVRSAASLAQTRIKHYYGRRLLQREFWMKVLRGGVGLGAIKGLLGNVRASRAAGPSGPSSYQERMACGWRALQGPLLLVMSGDDYTAKEFHGHAASAPHWQGLTAEERVSRVDLPGADHTFSDLRDSNQVNASTLTWLRSIA